MKKSKTSQKPSVVQLTGEQLVNLPDLFRPNPVVKLVRNVAGKVVGGLTWPMRGETYSSRHAASLILGSFAIGLAVSVTPLNVMCVRADKQNAQNRESISVAVAEEYAHLRSKVDVLVSDGTAFPVYAADDVARKAPLGIVVDQSLSNSSGHFLEQYSDMLVPSSSTIVLDGKEMSQISLVPESEVVAKRFEPFMQEPFGPLGFLISVGAGLAAGFGSFELGFRFYPKVSAFLNRLVKAIKPKRLIGFCHE